MLPTPHTLAKICHLEGRPFIVVMVRSVKGSTPRDEDAVLVVSVSEVAGTIGGGRLEWDAIAAARQMLKEGLSEQTLSIVLGPDLGQCCGGHVTLRLRRGVGSVIGELGNQEEQKNAGRPAVIIYGSGHVGRALAAALAPLPFRVALIDGRADELKLFHMAGVETVLTAHLPRYAESAPAGAAHVIMTHSHAEDSLIAAALLERGDFAYLGIIGSATKRALFLRAFRETGVPEELIARVVCPIGGSSVRDKRPEVIAAMTAAEITVALMGCSLRPA